MVGCPSCGVAVVPGYVKCPRCHAVLPRTTTARRAAVDEGGTTVRARAFPVAPVALGAIAVAVVLVLVLGGGDDRKSTTQPTGTQPAGTQPAGTQPAGTQPAGTQPAGTQPAGTPPAGTIEAFGPAASTPAVGVPAPAADAELAIPTTSAPAPASPAPAPQAAPRPLDIPATGPSPAAAVAELERALGRQRLWSSVETAGARVDVRSGSCGDPAMAPMIDAARATLRSVGLTRLRCLAQSGAVVFERDL